MKTTDLMVGDWVSSQEVHTKDYYLPSFKRQVAQIKDNGVELSFTDRYGNKCYITLLYDDIEPIPLTAEILEKNFRADKQWDNGWFVNDHIHIYQTTSGVYNIQYMEIVDIQYVHELQHALRLCGIEKEIQL